MQKLQFEPAWDRTISAKDRNLIERTFHESEPSEQTFTPLRQAINHNKDLLVTVIVNNNTQRLLSFKNKELEYLEKEQLIAEHIFTIPALAINPNSSMPWTFIFPKQSIKKEPQLSNGRLYMKEKLD